MLKQEKQNPFDSWSEAISSIKFTETVYVLKNNPDEGRYKIVSVAQDYNNPESKIVTFYKKWDEEGIIHFMRYEDFIEQFEAIQV